MVATKQQKPAVFYSMRHVMLHTNEFIVLSKRAKRVAPLESASRLLRHI
jgi:hypothetical protein